MNTKTVITATILASMIVENSLKHKDGDPHTHNEDDQAIHNPVIGITYISGIRVEEHKDGTYSYGFNDM